MKFNELNSFRKSFANRKILLTTKYTIVLLIITFLQVSARGFAQSDISLSLKEVSLEKALQEVTKQSGYDVFFFKIDLGKTKPVTINVKKRSLQQVLDDIFKDQPIEYTIESKTIVVKEKKRPSFLAFIDVSGKVLDENGKGIKGASVRIKDGNIMVATDETGNFALKNIPENSILIISYIGYSRQEIKVLDKNITIRLVPENNELNEVVVVGYGSKSKRDLISSVSTVKREDLLKTPSSNISTMLQGKVSGFSSQQRSGQPGQDNAQFFIRGLATEAGSGTQTPLIIIDDVQADYNQFSRINPSDVETVSILKDAAATAIYGIQGANGVVLVTTRRGKLGIAKIDLRSQLSIQQSIRPLKYLDSYQTSTLWNEMVDNEFKYKGNNATQKYKFTDAEIQKFADGSDPYVYPNVDWYNTLIKPAALMSTNDLNVSGGTERIKYLISLSYLWQNGVLKNIEPTSYYGPQESVNNNYYYKRYNFRSNLDIKATNSLDFKLDLSGYSDERNQPASSGNVFDAIGMFRNLPSWVSAVTNPDGSYAVANTTLRPWARDPNVNPNSVIGQYALGGYSRAFGSQLSINLSGVQKLDQLIPGLSVKGLAGYTNYNGSSRALTRGDFPSFQYYTNASGNGVYIPRVANTYRISPYSLSVSNLSVTPLNRLTMQGSLNYVRSFGKHNVGGLLLYNRSSQITASNDQNNMLPDKFQGYTGRFNYDYDHKYLLELSGAYNGTDRFNEKFGFFPSVALGYNIAEEQFFKNALPVVNTLKLRGSYGIVGTADLGGFRYLYLETFNIVTGVNSYNFGEQNVNISGITEGTLANPDVTWQKERKADVGIEFGIFKNTLTGSLTGFSNERYDILYNRQTIPLYAGIGTPPPQNLGRISNKGIEIELAYKGKVGEVGYNIGAMYSYAKNKILEKDEAPKLYPWLVQTGRSIGVEQMYFFDGFYSVEEAAKIKEETAALAAKTITKRTIATPVQAFDPIAGMLKYRDLNDDGVINTNDLAYSGYSNLPSTNVSLNLGVSYKNFAVSALFVGAFNFNYRISNAGGDSFWSNPTTLTLGRWTPETAASATNPILLYGHDYQSSTQNSSFWSEKSYYIRLRSVDFSYTFDNTFAKRIGLSNLRLIANASNLFTKSNVYKKYGLDPESTATGTSGLGAYPMQRLFNIGLNASF
ncbi:TonB-dependent receptor [Pedobacter frigoris]|uniref:TonB-dependent receptor n=1 Tax=Pedobacter frigoris TaxID=2571272 RepID=UPI00292E7747|nr:TonB-dependent receptor [Pedobacter frigoris]